MKRQGDWKDKLSSNVGGNRRTLLILFGGVALLFVLMYSLRDTGLKDRSGEFPSTVWMDPREMELIESHLKPDSIMLEYGSGASTLHYSKFVKEYKSVEHFGNWCKAVQEHARQEGRSNVELRCVSQNSPRESEVSWCIFDRCYSRYSQFKDYIEEGGKFGVKFDAVLIDGRARPQCAIFIRDYLRDDNSVIFIHDWNRRTGYHEILEVFDIVDQQIESNQPGGGGLVVLKRKPGNPPLSSYPDWWE